MRNHLRIFLFSFVLRWLLKIIVGVRFTVPTYLRYEERFIIVANHNSHLDTLSILAALPSRVLHRVKPIAARDHFGNTTYKARLSNYFLNALLIDRDRNDRKPGTPGPIEAMTYELDLGNSLIIFPEGTRGEPGITRPFKKGVGILLNRHPNIPYITAKMTGMGRALPKDDYVLIPFNATLEFGQPRHATGDVKKIVTELEQTFQKP